MSYRLAVHAEPGVELKRVVAEQAEKALASLDARPEGLHDAVHDARKRCKKIRAAFRLARPSLGPAYARENARYRDAARQLSGLRDSAAVVEAVALLRDLPEDGPDPELVDRLEESLAERRRTAVEALGDIEAPVARARSAIEEGVAALPEIELPAGGFRKTCARARARFLDCRDDPDDALMHEWRKRTKYHWYHLRLLQDCWPRAVSARARLCKELADLLGDERDLMLLARRLERYEGLLPEREAWELATRLSVARQRLRTRAQVAGAKLLAEKPGALTRRFEAYWRVEQEQLAA